MKKLGLVITIGLALSGNQASADIIYGSGQNVDLSSGYKLDPNWQVVATPQGWTAPSSVPYAAFIPQTVPAVYYGGDTGVNGSQGGMTTGGNHYYWLAPDSDAASLNLSSYNWIVAEQFNVTQAGIYNFDFKGAGDNRITFFINGAVDLTDAVHPTISGGTQIGNPVDQFGYISDFAGSAYLHAGTNTAYMVMYDYGGSTAAIIDQATFSPTFSAAPEPATIALLAIGIPSFFRIRRRKADIN